MYEDKYFRVWTGPFPFTRVALQAVPAESGVYQILVHGEVAYIGRSDSSIQDRLCSHLAGHGNWAAARRSSASGYEFVYFLCDTVSARNIETYVLNHDKPPYNRRREYVEYISNINVH